MGEKVMSGSRAFNYEQAMRIIELYEERNQFGRRLRTISEIANMFDTGDTTIQRIVNRQGGYRNLAPAVKNEEMEKRAAASIEKVLEMLQSPEEEKPPEENTALKTASDAVKAKFSAYTGKEPK